MEALAPTATAARPQTSLAAEAKDSAKIGADFDTFLSLLTAQLRNQDPLKPVDSTEFVAQLAEFSAVEQQVRGNDTLDKILGALGGEGPALLAPWLGTEVSAPAALRFDDAPLELTAPPDADATLASLVVRADGTGAEEGPIVARQLVDPRAETIRWDGEIGDGEQAEAGLYRFSLERTTREGEVTTTPLSGFSRVVEARLDDGAPMLVLEGGDTVNANDVTAIR